jgi:DNA-binding transcriptional ArsR family regulator
MKSITDGTAAIVMHPVRFNILQFIKSAEEPQYVEQIAKAVDEHPRLVSHHLNVLEDLGLVDCNYRVATAKGSSKRGVAVRLCKPTPKLTEVLQEIAEDAKAVAGGEKK